MSSEIVRLREVLATTISVVHVKHYFKTVVLQKLLVFPRNIPRAATLPLNGLISRTNKEKKNIVLRRPISTIVQ